jgi:hypothetical protein
MTTSQHLLRQYAVTTEISKLQHETMPDVMTDVLERQLRMETSAIGMTIQSISHRHQPSLFICEDGTVLPIVKLACIATGYMSDESAEQTLRKIHIANAQSDWTEDD